MFDPTKEARKAWAKIDNAGSPMAERQEMIAAIQRAHDAGRAVLSGELTTAKNVAAATTEALRFMGNDLVKTRADLARVEADNANLRQLLANAGVTEKDGAWTFNMTGRAIAAERERDAARAEVERLKAELASDQAFAVADADHEIGLLKADLAALRARLQDAENLLGLCIDGEDPERLSPTRSITADVRAFLAETPTLEALPRRRLSMTTSKLPRQAPESSGGLTFEEWWKTTGHDWFVRSDRGLAERAFEAGRASVPRTGPEPTSGGRCTCPVGTSTIECPVHGVARTVAGPTCGLTYRSVHTGQPMTCLREPGHEPVMGACQGRCGHCGSVPGGAK